MADQRLQALLEMERRGKLTPEMSSMLDTYRKQGATKTKAPTPTTQDTFETSKARDDARKAIDMIGRLQPQIDRVRELYQRDLKGAGPLRSVREYLPSQAHQQFDNAAAQLRLLARPATRTPGEGAMSDFETKLAVAPLPDRWSFDGANEESLRGLQSLVDDARKTYGVRMGLPTAPPATKSNSGWTITKD